MLALMKGENHLRRGADKEIVKPCVQPKSEASHVVLLDTVPCTVSSLPWEGLLAPIHRLPVLLLSV